MCLLCVCACESGCSQSPEVVLDPLQSELHVPVSHLMWLVGAGHQYSLSVASARIHWAISQAPQEFIFRLLWIILTVS